ncbi:MAG: 23S rRNA pseudouridine synthase, partial [Halothiobacillaceae bacterium]
MSDDGQAVDLLSAEVPYAMAGQRLDQVAALLFDNYSRARLQAWICEGKLTVDRQRRRSKDKVTGGEHLELLAEVEAQARWQPQQIALEIVYEDESLIIINKPAGLVVHPAVGNPEGT